MDGLSRRDCMCRLSPLEPPFPSKAIFHKQIYLGKIIFVAFFYNGEKGGWIDKKLIRSTKVICLYNLWKLCWTFESIMNENDLRRIDCYNMPQSNNELKVVPTVFCPITFLAKSNQHRSLRLPNIAWKVESGMHYNACNDFADLGKNRKRSFAQPILVI